MTNVTRSPARRPRSLVLLLLVVVFIIIVGGIYYLVFREEDEGAPKPDTVAGQEDAADNALGILRDLAEDNYTLLGFRSADEAESATLGMPLTMYLVPLDQLQAFEADASPSDLLHDSEIVLYPVLVDNTIRSAVSIQHSDDGWTPVAFGNVTLIQAIAETDLQEGDFIVQVPALGLYFVGARSDDELLLTSIVETAYDIPVGRPVNASEVFSILQPAAQEVDTDAPM